MSVRFVLGRAGSGKTHHCVSAIRRRLREDPVDGPRLILLVPEQASLQMERALIDPAWAGGAAQAGGRSPDGMDPSPPAAAHRAEVLSFQRLAFRVLEQVGAPARTALTEEARVMVLRFLVSREAAGLRYYRRMDRSGGFLQRLSATIAELIQENIAPESLNDAPADAGGFADLPLFAATATATDLSPHQRAKLHDLQVLYAAYLDYLGTRLLDPTQHLQLARGHLSRCGWLVGAELWIDGFASFSEQEHLTLLALAKLVDRADITLLVDPAMLRTGSTATPYAAGRLFSRTQETLGRLRDRLRNAGVAELPALELAPPTPPRFAAGPKLADLERHLFQARPRELGGAAGAGGVEIVELPTRRVEVEYAISRVCHWVQDPRNPLRYRDIALVVRDLEPYHDLLADALRSRNIPFFIDRRRPITHHPLVELIRGAIAAGVEDFSVESVRLLLKTDLLGLSRKSTDELENYLLACGIFGWAAWRETWTRRPGPRKRGQEEQKDAERQDYGLLRLNQSRAALIDLFRDWMAFASSPAANTGADWSRQLLAVLERCQAGATMEAWAEGQRLVGELEAALEHEQAWAGVLSVLDDLTFALGDAPLTCDELGSVLEAGLATLTLGLTPPTVDQVLVGSIERSRHPDIKAAVILGFNDGVFPKRESEDSILNDDDRDALQDRGLAIRPGARERMLDESLLVYIALTRPSESVVVSHAAADEQGRALRPSPFVHDLRAALPGLAVRGMGDPVRGRDTWDVQCPSDLRRRLAEEFSARPAREEDSLTGPSGADRWGRHVDRDGASPALPRGDESEIPEVHPPRAQSDVRHDPHRSSARSRWNAIYAASRGRLRPEPLSRYAFAGLDESEDARLSPATLSRLFPAPVQTSVSQLESYAACPFQFFAKFVLRLRDRLEAVLKPLEIGQVNHAILEDVARQLAATDRGFGQLSEADVDDAVREACERVVTHEGSDEWFAASNAQVLRRSAVHLSRVLQAQRRRSLGTNARTVGGELRFGFGPDGDGLPAVQINSPSGRAIMLRGFIDRLDVIEDQDRAFGVVIDYKKTRDRKLDLSEVYHGLSLQLPAYLLVVAETAKTTDGRPIQPAAGLYVSLTPSYELVAHPNVARDDDSTGTFRPRGLISDTAVPYLDPGVDGRSSRYRMFVKGDGMLGDLNKTDAAEEAGFRAILNYTRHKLGGLADGMLDGRVPVSPCRMADYNACRWCTLKPVCRVEPGLTKLRYLERMRRKEALRRLRDEPAEP